ncbi:COQ9 family protein [Pontibaca salina]|uniref:COQ9 family protein n=1 Tax=Pontibaca salina TaxID=2795731 RepID=A0A934HT63_9RHOB|nr:COQ9 family protein [Pontibaca salina]MBI6629753.1 COQ9 family protein [Pontibaca salina]
MTEYQDSADQILDAALTHVIFDGWSESTFRTAITDSDVPPALARAMFPRGAVDLALAWHDRGDAEMVARLEAADLADLRVRDRIATAIRYRIEAIDDKEVMRRSATFFALPQHAPDGARALWRTCDLIWTTLGDSSDDVNWYTKRATLSGVYSAVLLYWLGDSSDESTATWEFLDRRIDEVMRIENLKAQVQDNPLLKPFLVVPNWFLGQIRPPRERDDLPGTVYRRR